MASEDAGLIANFYQHLRRLLPRRPEPRFCELQNAAADSQARKEGGKPQLRPAPGEESVSRAVTVRNGGWRQSFERERARGRPESLQTAGLGGASLLPADNGTWRVLGPAARRIRASLRPGPRAGAARAPHTVRVATWWWDCSAAAN